MRQASLNRWLPQFPKGASRECWDTSPGVVRSPGRVKFDHERLKAQASLGTMTIRREEEAFWLPRSPVVNRLTSIVDAAT